MCQLQEEGNQGAPKLPPENSTRKYIFQEFCVNISLGISGIAQQERGGGIFLTHNNFTWKTFLSSSITVHLKILSRIVILVPVHMKR
jgi:hypothetical protein